MKSYYYLYRLVHTDNGTFKQKIGKSESLQVILEVQDKLMMNDIKKFTEFHITYEINWKKGTN